MRGERRGSALLTNVVVCAGMSVTGGVVGSGTGGVGVGGGVFARVWRQWIWGAVQMICGAVGFVEVGIDDGTPFEKEAPFERIGGVPSVSPHGTVAGSYVGVCDVSGVTCCRRAWSMVVNSRLRAGRGKCSMQRTSSCATCSVCSMGVSVRS
jgi:hypothetical protein